MPSFSGKVYDLYKGSTKTYSDGTPSDTFDPVSSGPEKITLKIKKIVGEVGTDYLIKEYPLDQIINAQIPNNEKYKRFYITLPYPLIDGYYQVNLILQDKAGNTYDYPSFYLSLNYFSSVLEGESYALGGLLGTSKKRSILGDKTIETEIINIEEVPQASREQQGYTLTIKTIDKENKPLSGVRVEVHSEPVLKGKTDKEGIVSFTGVSPGDHTIKLAYKGNKGEQEINLSGDNSEFKISIQVNMQSPFLNPWTIIVIGILILIISYLVYKRKKEEKNV